MKIRVRDTLLAVLLLVLIFTGVGCGLTGASATKGTSDVPAIVAQPSGHSVLVGQTATFSISANGTAPLSYQWQKNGAPISGATSTSYTTPPAKASDDGSMFQAVVSNSVGSVTSLAAKLTVSGDPIAPTIATQPTSQTVTAGQAATFSVVANGTAPLAYQWQKNGAPIAGATSASYSTPATIAADSGATFSVVVSNSGGSATSNSATLTVNSASVAPTIAVQPASQSITAGQTATFSVVANGTAPLNYQWQKNGAPLNGATSASYTTPATTTADSGESFVVVVSNSVGNATSIPATLTVNASAVPPTITSEPSNQSVTAGQTATFTVAANGTAPLSYLWQKNGVTVGGNSTSYTTPPTTSADNGSSFVVIVSNSKGSITSTPAILTVNPASVAPSINTQPASATVTTGQTATFSVVANGTAPLSYQWQRSGAAISGATAASYTTPATTNADNGATFAVVVSNTAGSATSATATLTVNPAPVPPSIATQPAGTTVTAGQTATFSVVANGTAPLSYQWQKNGAAISGATAASYTTPTTTNADNGANFAVVVSNSKGSVTSAAATLTVSPASVAPSIATQPASQTVTVGQTAVFSVVANGTAPLSYQWQKNGAAISGATSASYTTPATSSSNNGATFKVIVTNSVGSATSNPATLTVNAAVVALSITTEPTSQTVAAGQTATFRVVATGAMPLTYQWTENGANVGTNSATYTTPATTSADNGAKIQVTVSNSAENVLSAIATLTVNSVVTPTITTQPQNASVTVGQTAAFTVVATGAAPLTYQWTENGTNVGTNAASYTTPANNLTDNGAKIRVTVSNSAGSTLSSIVTLTVAAPPPSTANVLTYHNDNGRTGQNLNETILTTAKVNSASFGKKAFLAADGLVDAEPLYVSNLNIGTNHNVVFIVTEHDSVYAYDTDTFQQLWKVSMLGSGETTSEAVNGCDQVSPEIGITSTPVIDLNVGPNGTMYLIAMSKRNGTYIQRIHALDLTTGLDVAGSPVTIQAKFPGTGANSSGGFVVFDPKQYKERASLLLLNGVVYTSWASHCDDDPYTGWVVGYSESSLQQVSVINITPNGSRAAIWMSGAGLAADSNGNIYFLAGNGTFDDTLNSSGFPQNGDYGNGFIKLSTNGGLSVADYFTMFNTDSESAGDVDLGSGGAMVLPDLKDSAQNTWHLAVGAGKDGNMYIVNRDMMGKFNTVNDNAIYQEIDGALPGGVWAMPAYFNNTVYYGSVGSTLKAFSISNAKLATSGSSHSSASFGYPGTTPSVSANGTSNGIVWAVTNGGTAVLHAYDATNLATELYNSNQAANNRDHFSGNKFITPMIANGKVFVGTPTGVIVFGLLP